VQRFERRKHVEHAAHADVVGDAAVDQVNVSMILAVGEHLQLLQPLHRARSGPRRIGIVEENPRPGRQLVAAGAPVVVDGDRRAGRRGPPTEAAAARASRMLDRSVHRTSKFSGLKMSRVPSARSVAPTRIRGPSRFKSLNVAPLNRISS
jgi:hypothetical protein